MLDVATTDLTLTIPLKIPGEKLSQIAIAKDTGYSVSERVGTQYYILSTDRSTRIIFDAALNVVALTIQGDKKGQKLINALDLIITLCEKHGFGLPAVTPPIDGLSELEEQAVFVAYAKKLEACFPGLTETYELIEKIAHYLDQNAPVLMEVEEDKPYGKTDLDGCIQEKREQLSAALGKDDHEAYEHFKAIVNGEAWGNVTDAFFKLGVFEQNSTMHANSHFRKAANQGHAEAQYLLGLSKLITLHYGEAFALLNKAAGQGIIGAQFMLGEYYLAHLNSPLFQPIFETEEITYKKAFAWYQESVNHISEELFDKSKIKAKNNPTLRYCIALSNRDPKFTQAVISKDPNDFFERLMGDTTLSDSERYAWIKPLLKSLNQDNLVSACIEYANHGNMDNDKMRTFAKEILSKDKRNKYSTEALAKLKNPKINIDDFVDLGISKEHVATITRIGLMPAPTEPRVVDVTNEEKAASAPKTLRNSKGKEEAQ